MAENTTTLRHVLSRQKPLIFNTATANRNSTSVKWPDIGDFVTIWDDFNLNNLNESYGHVLDYAFPEQLPMGPRPEHALAGVVVKTCEDIKHLISWNAELMQPTLQFAKSHLRLHPGVIFHHAYSTADKSSLASIPNESKRLTVDHVIALDDFPRQNLVVGLGRTSSKWSGRKVANQPNKIPKEFLWPLRQLGNLCKIAQTRYGYIQTDEETVVCCFSNNGKELKTAIMPIPWSRNGVHVLTTDLALWWLCMLAISSPHHRAIVGEGEMVRINDWDVYLDEERGWVRRHRYSNVEEPTSPPPPDNTAAFAAGAGLNMNEWFNFDLPNVDLGGFHLPDAQLGDFDLGDFHSIQ